MLNSLLIYRENTEILDHPISERTCIKKIKKYTRILIIQSSDNPILKKKKKQRSRAAIQTHESCNFMASGQI
jgi:hypothetical protein